MCVPCRDGDDDVFGFFEDEVEEERLPPPQMTPGGGPTLQRSASNAVEKQTSADANRTPDKEDGSKANQSTSAWQATQAASGQKAAGAAGENGTPAVKRRDKKL